MKLVTGLLICLVAIIGVGCSQSSQDAEGDLCTAMATMGAAIDSVKAIGPTSTIQEYNDALAAVDAAQADVKTAAGDVSAARAAELQTAIDTYKSGVGSINDDATLMGAAATVNAQGTMLRQSYDEIYASLSCPATQ